MYITHAELNDSPGARELAEVATAQHEQLIPYELMELTLLAGDRSAYSADEIARADDALARIDDAVNQASELIDGYIVRRYALPFDPAPRILTTWNRAIARYYLHKDRISDEKSDPIARDYRDALKLLGQVADGKLFLGAGDLNATDPNDLHVQFDSDENVFSREQLGSFR